MFEKAVKCVSDGIGTAFPGAVLAIGRGNDVFVREAVGEREIKPEHKKMELDTLFDLASLSKLVSTTMVALRLLEEGKICLHDDIGMYLPDTGNFGDVQIINLMTHTSGITPHLPLWTECKEGEDPISVILHSKPYCKPWEQVHYSCMGYITLQRILENITGRKLDELAREYVFEPLGMKTACYNPKSENVAATEFSAVWNDWTTGHVHDENAHFLGGVSGNAGVFASIDDMIRIASMFANHGVTPEGELFLTRRVFDLAIHNFTPELDESRGLGFQLMGKQWSPMGDLMSPGSYGHTGFTGTSMYIDSETGLWGILLTNSVHYGRNNRGASFPLRRRFFNLLTVEYERSLKGSI